MQLSIIVPVYNVAPYLHKCVDSLLAQDISDYEIILVDVGSPDECPNICDEYATAYNNIRVIHQENTGLSAARNSGIAVAQGEYIWFVDSDDYVESNVLGLLIEQIERDDLDVLRFRYQNVRASGEAFAPYKDMTNYNDYSVIPTDGLSFLNKRMGNQCYVWQFIVRNRLCSLETFTQGIYYEDTDWMPRMLLRAYRVASADIVVYNYFWREGSITLTRDLDKLRKQLYDKMNLINKLKKMSDLQKDCRWFSGMISGVLLSIIEIVALSFYDERKRFIQQIKKMDILPITSYHIPPRAQIKIKLINLSLQLAINSIHYKNIYLLS